MTPPEGVQIAPHYWC